MVMINDTMVNNSGCAAHTAWSRASITALHKQYAVSNTSCLMRTEH
jgi:hypothetical protein